MKITFLTATVIVVVLMLLLMTAACQPTNTQEVKAPSRTGTPTQMKEQCINQPDIPYCVKRCDDTLLKPSWC